MQHVLHVLKSHGLEMVHALLTELGWRASCWQLKTPSVSCHENIDKFIPQKMHWEVRPAECVAENDCFTNCVSELLWWSGSHLIHDVAAMLPFIVQHIWTCFAVFLLYAFNASRRMLDALTCLVHLVLEPALLKQVFSLYNVIWTPDTNGSKHRLKRQETTRP